ncbi:MAG: hypothetical protein IPM02_24850 [Betaproteobacteria bacterium]|nr:hypothetical protein [Betaproteobacteria bacterium]
MIVTLGAMTVIDVDFPVPVVAADHTAVEAYIVTLNGVRADRAVAQRIAEIFFLGLPGRLMFFARNCLGGRLTREPRSAGPSQCNAERLGQRLRRIAGDAGDAPLPRAVESVQE